MQIEAGKFYRTRDGQKVGPMIYFGIKGRFIVTVGDGAAWEGDGRGLVDGKYDWSRDLIAEWIDEPASPVRTRTVSEIVPGDYGIVHVGGNDGKEVSVDLNGRPTCYSAAELRAAAAVFVQLADALEAAE